MNHKGRDNNYLPNVDDFDAVILGLGGVITRTTALHVQAWKEVLDEFLQEQKTGRGEPHQPLDPDEDYRRFLAGKRCDEGLRSFLQARKINLPLGSYDDQPDEETIWGLGNRKDREFRTLLDKNAPEVFEDTVAQLESWRKRGLKIGVVSFSRECNRVLKSAGINRLVDTVVDGLLAARQNLKAKPHPDALTYASLILNVDPQRVAYIDDALDGIEAGRKAKFGLVVGIDRHQNPDPLLARGAHVVIESVGKLAVPLAGQPDRRTLHRPPSALKCLGQIKQQLRKKRVALFLDYDGTLTPIVNRPEDAKLSDEMRETLSEVASICPVAVVSGRGRADVEQLVDIPNLIYAGSHGFEITGPNDLHMEYEEGVKQLPHLDQAEKMLQKELKTVPGAQVERKKFAIAIHYRNVPEEHVKKVEPAVDRVQQQLPQLRKGGGKKVFELRPDLEWDKGHAVLWLLRALGLDKKEVVPVYIGDDVTDEDAFRELRSRGIGIIVGHPQRPTDARYSLEDVGEVRHLLSRLIGLEDGETSQDGWKFVYEGYSPEEEPLREALCTIGNGYFATRGAGEETQADGTHYPGTYLAGGYNRLNTEIAGRQIENEDLVNWPNWLCLSFRHPGGNWFNLNDMEITEYRQELDLRRGLLERKMRFTDEEGRRTSLLSRRLVHMGDQHVAAIQWILTPEDWSGPIEIRSALDGTVVNAGVKRYRELNSQHLEPIEIEKVSDDTIFLRVRTTQSRIEMCQAARTRIYRNGEETKVKRRTDKKNGLISQCLSFECKEGEAIRVEKVVAVSTSRDRAISEPGLETRQVIAEAETFDRLLQTHLRPWARIWHRCDITIDGNSYTQLILRLHIFHLVQTVSANTIDMDVGIPARGWHGEAYRGHIFWDEIFIFPFLNFRTPTMTRSLLMYRYRRLTGARRHAKNYGYQGAMYPWQSGSSGREETQVVHLNPRSGRWVPDNTHRQVHINGAIVYNIWHYLQATRDIHFLSHYGAKMIFEIARFWSSIATFNKERNRFEIRGVVGPDEYHTKYPDRDDVGLNNNAYTNILAAWSLWRALDVLDLLSDKRGLELRRELEVSDQEKARWEEISRRMFVPFHGDGIISQFEGYENLEEFDWQAARKKWGDIHRLDRLLEAHGDTTNRYKVSKQSDVLMLFYLFTAERLQQIFERLGYPFSGETIQKNIEYYEERTSHGSTLSRLVHSWVLARADREGSWHHFVEALKSDVEDVQGGTTPEGIHLGAMAGTIDLIQRAHLGMAIRDDVLWLNPHLPEQLPKLRVRILFQGRWISIQATHSDLRVRIEAGSGGNVRIGFRDEIYILSTNRTLVWSL